MRHPTLTLCLILAACAADGADRDGLDGGVGLRGDGPLSDVVSCTAWGYYYRDRAIDVPGEPTDAFQAWECTGTPEQVQADFGEAWNAWCVAKLGCTPGFCRCEPECVVVPVDKLPKSGTGDDGGFPVCTLEILQDCAAFPSIPCPT